MNFAVLTRPSPPPEGFDSWEEFNQHDQLLQWQTNKVVAEKEIRGWLNGKEIKVTCWVCWEGKYEALCFRPAPGHGVTGSESFKLSRLKEGWDKPPYFERFCICAGSNTWSSLYLDKEEVYDFISPRW